METERARRTDRINLEMPIKVSGMDETGRAFSDETWTVRLSRFGATIRLNRKLIPHQELIIHCLETGQDAEARVVGLLGESPEGQLYGIEFLDSEANPWGIDFPPLTESGIAVGRLLLECVSCQSRELSYLSEHEAEVFHLHKQLSRFCKHCTSMSLWKSAQTQPQSEGITPQVHPELARGPHQPAPRRVKNRREHSRVGVKLNACVRSPQFGEEIVDTDDVSRGGFSFKSTKHYAKGCFVETAAPYSRDSAKTFAAAQIVRVEVIPGEGMILYGLSYVSREEGRRENRRGHRRVGLRLAVCIRHPQLGEEVLVTENVSRGGLCFKSSKHYARGWIVDVAAPYSAGSGNIFVSARVVRVEAMDSGFRLYGVSYIQSHKGSSSPKNPHRQGF